MSVDFFSSSYQPVSKTVVTLTPNTTFQIWAPATSRSVGITDIMFSSAASGTVQLLFSTDLTKATNITKGPEFLAQGSVMVYPNLESPIMGTADQIVYGVTGFGGYAAITLSGFEQD